MFLSEEFEIISNKFGAIKKEAIFLFKIIAYSLSKTASYPYNLISIDWCKYRTSRYVPSGFSEGLKSTKKVVDEETLFSCLSNHFNIISYNDHKLKVIPLHWSWWHVKGHQDNHQIPLDLWALLKVEYDYVTKIQWKKYQYNRSTIS